MEHNKSTCEVFGLSEDQIVDLSKRFGDAVHSYDKEDGTMVVDLSNVDMQNMTMDGYFIKNLPSSSPK